MDDQYVICEIEENDFDPYMNLMFEFTNYKYEITKEEFCKKINNIKDKNKIILLYSSNKKELIGCGTIIKLEKLHNNPVGQIEDVIVTEKYRGKGLGKIIIDTLVNIGLTDFKCYKIILNCLDKNIGFYKKCRFNIAGVEMKYII